ncbi:MAG: endonuclease [Bacteroidetes bacterium]|nr:endonuclease [Bacteroidota bacterium]
MRKIFLILLLLCFKLTIAQITPVTVKVDTTITKVQGSKSFYVRNPSNKAVQVTGIRTLLSQFYYTTAPFTINPNDSVLVTVLFKTNQNVTYRDFFIFETKGLKYPLVYYLLATAKYPESYYAFSQGLYDEALKSAIKTFTTTGHIPLTYNTARDAMYGTIDHYESPDTIECIYTGRKAIVRTRAEATAQNFNCEHTLPQSFFNSNVPMVSDLFHLYPTDETANNARSNYPFGKVVSNITWQTGGSKLGKDSTGETVFEPRDVHKGNVARSLFYFCVTYPSSFGSFMSVKQENILRQWNVLDTVDAKERLRNTRIHTAQNTYNPFIDHPEIVDRITSVISTANATPKAKISAAPFNVQFDTVAANDTTSYYIAVMNYGNASLTISSAVSSITQFVVESVPASIPQGEMRYIKVKFRPTVMNQTYSGTLNISNSDSPITVNLNGVCGNSSAINLISNEVPDKFGLEQNYPNPFNPTTNIRFSVAGNSFVTLKVYDMLGREAAVLVNRNLQPGVYEAPFTAGNSAGSGVYFVRLSVNNEQVAIKKMVLTK